MSSVSETRDFRISIAKIDGGSFLAGLLYSRLTSGGDRTPADKLAGIYPDHSYQGFIHDDYVGYVDVVRTKLSAPFDVASGAVGPITYYVTPDVAWSSNDDIKLLGKLSSSINNGAKWNAGIFVGELGKTVDSVTSRAKQLAEALRAIRRLDVSKACSVLRAPPPRPGQRRLDGGSISPASLWLEIRYAWRPLINDIYDLSESIQKMDQPRFKHFRVQHFNKVSLSTNSPFYVSIAGGGKDGKYMKATIAEKPFSFPEYLGLTNPAAILWELVPLSFVADWFIPIGNYLETRSALEGVEGSFVTTRFTNYRGRISANASTDSGGYHYDMPSASGSTSGMSIERTLSNSIGVPLPSFRSAGFESKPLRCLDAIALITSAVKGL